MDSEIWIIFSDTITIIFRMRILPFPKVVYTELPLELAESFNCWFITRFSHKGRELELGINAECALGIQRLQEEVYGKKQLLKN